MTSSEEKSFYNGIKAIHSTNNHFGTNRIQTGVLDDNLLGKCSLCE